nr:histone H1-like [Ipomoea batatas]
MSPSSKGANDSRRSTSSNGTTSSWKPTSLRGAIDSGKSTTPKGAADSESPTSPKGAAYSESPTSLKGAADTSTPLLAEDGPVATASLDRPSFPISSINNLIKQQLTEIEADTSVNFKEKNRHLFGDISVIRGGHPIGKGNLVHQVSIKLKDHVLDKTFHLGDSFKQLCGLKGVDQVSARAKAVNIQPPLVDKIPGRERLQQEIQRGTIEDEGEGTKHPVRRIMDSDRITYTFIKMFHRVFGVGATGVRKELTREVEVEADGGRVTERCYGRCCFGDMWRVRFREMRWNVGRQWWGGEVQGDGGWWRGDRG